MFFSRAIQHSIHISDFVRISSLITYLNIVFGAEFDEANQAPERIFEHTAGKEEDNEEVEVSADCHTQHGKEHQPSVEH